CLEVLVGRDRARARVALPVPQQQLAAAAEEGAQVGIPGLVPLRELAAANLHHVLERHPGEVDRAVAEDDRPQPAEPAAVARVGRAARADEGGPAGLAA